MKHSDKKLLLGIMLSAGCIFIATFVFGILKKQEEKSLVKTEPPIEITVQVEESSTESVPIEESESSEAEEPVRELTGAEELDEGIIVYPPQEMEWEEAVALLESRKEEDERYKKILDRLDSYPKMLVMDLVANPEMLSFVYDYPDGTGLEPLIRQVEMEQVCPLFLQWDKRWGYHKYGEKSTIAVSGCGPTALAMVATALIHEPVTPLEVAEYAMEMKYYLPGVGTMWSLMTTGAKNYGLDSEQISPDEDVMKKMLDRGEMLICSMRRGDFTIKGHFIVIYGYDSEGFLINDPMCIYRSKQHWEFKNLKKQFKGLWSLCPEGQKPEGFYQQPEVSQVEEAEPDPEEESSAPVNPPQSETPIVPQEPVPSDPPYNEPSEPSNSTPPMEEPSESETESVVPTEPSESEDPEQSDPSEDPEQSDPSEESESSAPEEPEIPEDSTGSDQEIEGNV